MWRHTSFTEYKFNTVDYWIFITLTLASTGIGIYLGVRKVKKPSGGARVSDDEQEFYSNFHSHGSKKFDVFPIAMSLIGSYVTGVTLLGAPSEIYLYGTQYVMVVVAILVHAFLLNAIFVPVYLKLRVASSYEYLERRFNHVIRTLIALLFILNELICLPIIVYIPSIALQKVTGVNSRIIVICFIGCTLYTIFGGVKVIVHTGAWQVYLIYVTIIVVPVFGAVSGGLSNIFVDAYDGRRLIVFDMDPSFTKRYTFWNCIFGNLVIWISYNATSQVMVQRYLSLPTVEDARKAVNIFSIGMICLQLSIIFCGLLLYSYYKTCDPVMAGLVEKSDQLFAIYIVHSAGHMHGVPGLLMAGVFGAALSSLSVEQNSTALVIYEDIVKGCMGIKLTDFESHIFIKVTILILGIEACSGTYVLEKMGPMFAASSAFISVSASTAFTVFFMGMCIPWANAKGAICSILACATITGWLAFVTQFAIASGYEPKQCPQDTSGCGFNVTNLSGDFGETFSSVYRISFLWIGAIGVSISLPLGVFVSFITGATDPKTLDADLLAPIIHKYIPKECFTKAKENAPQ